MKSIQTRLLSKLAAAPGATPVALVTGAAGAMGAAIAARLARAGMALVLVDVQGEQAKSVAESLPGGAVTIEADLARAEAAAEIMQIVDEQLGGVDHVVNNAGLNRPQTLFDLQPADWDAVQAVNLRAPVFLCKAAIPSWQRRGGGSVVNIGSRVWLSGAVPAYTASKAGIVGLTRSLALELGPMNVRANAVAPSYVDTPFTRMNRPAEDIARREQQVLGITPLGRIGVPEDVANAVAFLASAEASFVTGEILHVCGGAQMAAPSNPFPARAGRS